MTHSKPRALALGVLVALLLTGPSGTGHGQAPPPSPAPSGYGVALDVTPMDAAATQFQCHAVVSELPSGKVISEPSLHVKAGETGLVRTKDGAGTEVSLSITVQPGGQAASYDAEVRRSGSAVALQRGALALRPGARKPA